jgi:hypothetical protein
MPYAEFTLEDLIFKKTRVIKISSCLGKRLYNSVVKVINKQIKNKDPDIVRVYNLKLLSSKDKYFTYKYSMDKLFDPTKDELKDICRYSYDLNRDTYSNKKLFDFMQRIDKKGYLDLHDENVMVDKSGNYKLIDLEGFLHSCYFR